MVEIVRIFNKNLIMSKYNLKIYNQNYVSREFIKKQTQIDLKKGKSSYFEILKNIFLTQHILKTIYSSSVKHFENY